MCVCVLNNFTKIPDAGLDHSYTLVLEEHRAGCCRIVLGGDGEFRHGNRRIVGVEGNSIRNHDEVLVSERIQGEIQFRMDSCKSLERSADRGGVAFDGVPMRLLILNPGDGVSIGTQRTEGKIGDRSCSSTDDLLAVDTSRERSSE